MVNYYKVLEEATPPKKSNRTKKTIQQLLDDTKKTNLRPLELENADGITSIFIEIIAENFPNVRK